MVHAGSQVTFPDIFGFLSDFLECMQDEVRMGRRWSEQATVSAGDLHYIPLTSLLMAPITEIGPNWHQPKLDRPKVLLSRAQV